MSEKTMAEVIHGRHCLERIHNEGCMFWQEDHESAEALSAAGFGPVKEAKAEAWDECEAASYEIRLEPGGKFWQPYKDNPYRPVS